MNPNNNNNPWNSYGEQMLQDQNQQSNSGTANPFTQNKKVDFNDPFAPTMQSGASANAFLARVFTIMMMGLGITALVSWLVASKMDPMFFHMGAMRWILMLAPLAFILVLSFGINRISYAVATILFVGFATCMGLSLAYIFVIFSLGTIFQVFLITGVSFGAMALVGYTTSIDLTRIGSFLIFALIGIIIASVVNWMIGSSMLELIISAVGVLIFAGLTAYDTQRLLRIGAQVEVNSEDANKMAVFGAFSLYLNFLNMFLFLLQLFGGGD